MHKGCPLTCGLTVSELHVCIAFHQLAYKWELALRILKSFTLSYVRLLSLEGPL